MRARLKVSRAGVELIKSFEGLRTTAARLPDGRWTLGYGHTFSAREGATVTQEDADALLRFDLLPIVDAINNLVLVPLNQNQFDALVSFCFNIGVDNFAASTVLKRINEGKMTEAALAMDSWRSAEFNGQTYVLAPLIRRRAAEKNLFLTPEEVTGNAPSLLVRPVEDASPAPAHPAEIEAPAPGGILSARPLGQPEAAPVEPAPGTYTPPFEISATPAPVPATAAPQPAQPAERQVIDLASFAPRPQDAAPAKPTIQLVADVAPSVPGVVEQSPTAYDYDPTPVMSPEVQAALFRAQEEQRAAEQRAQEQRLQEEARRQAEALAAARLAEEVRQREEQRRREEERLQELQRQELLRLETERLERERLDRERLDRERLEREAQMRAELARLEQERLEQERRERERLEDARAEAIRLEAERLDRERQEAEQREQVRLEAQRLEAERLERERHEAEQRELARLEAERLDRERAEAARLESERQEAARQEAARLEQARLEQARLEQERRDNEERARLAEAAERMRAEQARLEQARLERERQERERQLQTAAAGARVAEDADAEKARKAEAAAALMRLYSPYGSGALGKPLTPQPVAQPVAPRPAQPQSVQPQPVVAAPAPEPAGLSVPEPEEDDEESGFAGGASFTPFQPVQSPSTMPPPTVTALNPYARPIQKTEGPKEAPRDVLVEVPRPAPVNPAAPSNAPFAGAQPEAPAQAPHWREQLNRPLPENRPEAPEQTRFMQASTAPAQDAFADDEWTFDGDRVALSAEEAEEEHASWWRMIVSTAWWILFSCFGLGLLGFAAAAYWRSAYDQAVLREGHQTDLMMLSVVMAAAGIFFVCVSVWLILKRLGGLKD